MVVRELEAENYTVSIAAKRSFSLYGLEGPNPNVLMVYVRVRVRSVEVDGFLGRFWGHLFGRPDGFGS